MLTQEIDVGKVTALTLLDLSAAFDTIDHSDLLDLIGMTYWTQHSIDILDTTLTWIRSFLINTSQSIKIRSCFYRQFPRFEELSKALFLDYYCYLLCLSHHKVISFTTTNYAIIYIQITPKYTYLYI